MHCALSGLKLLASSITMFSISIVLTRINNLSVQLILTLFLITLSEVVSAQQVALSGTVTDTRNQALSGVIIYLQGSNVSTVSDPKGKFSLAGPLQDSIELTASLVGYRTAVVPLNIKNNRVFIRITLHTLSHELNEVIVKDRSSELRKQEESLNVEVVKSDFIQRHLGGSLMKTLERMPGIKTIGIGSGQSKPLIRGLGFNRVVVVDKGIKHEGQQWGADHGLELDQFAAGEVELIKGAASFIYGSDAIGGAIDVKPLPVPQANSLGGAVDLIGKTNNMLYGTSLNLAGRKQHWFFDSRFTYQKYGDYEVPADMVQVYGYRVKLYQKHLRNTAGMESGLHLNTGYISDHFRSVFYISNIYSKSGFFANAHGLEPRQVDAALYDRSARDIGKPSQKVNHLKIINKSSWHTGGHKFETELGYQRNFREEFSQYVNHGYMPPVYPVTMSIPPDLERQFDKHVYSANLRDQFSLGEHSLTVGLNAEHQDNTISGWTFLVPAFKQSTAGAFVYDKFRLNERIVLHGAARYDYGHIRSFKYTDWFLSRQSEGPPPVYEKIVRAGDLKRNFHSVVWSVGMNYNPEKFALKANVGKSFRMPVSKELGANGVNYHYFSYERGDATLSPEQSYQADLSLGWNEERWSVQLSPFYNYFPNYIYLNPTASFADGPGAGYQVFQYAQSRVMRYGGEVQLKYRFLHTLSSELLGEYLYSEQLSGDKEGYTLPFSPPASLLFNLTWSPLLIKKLSDTYLSVDYRITGRQDNIVPPEKETPGYRTVNLQAGTKIKMRGQYVMISLQAQNLLNTRYLNHTSFYRLIELPEAGRNIILSLKVPFQIKI